MPSFLPDFTSGIIATTTRREFLVSAMSAFVASSCATRNTQPATEPGKIWLNMNQEELDAAYTQRNWAPNQVDVLARYKSAAETFRANSPPPIRMTYGPGPSEGLDVWKANKPTGKVLIFIHGGAWAGGTAAEYCFVAGRWVHAGVHVVIPDFSTAKEANGNLSILADQVRSAVKFTYEKANSFGGNPDSIYIAGHSSGAHLAAVAMTTDWQSRHLPKKLFSGGILISGMYDLKPVGLSSRSRYIRFNDEMEHSLSPQRHLPSVNAPLLVANGANESPEFKRQSADFVAAAKRKRKTANLVTENLNHFEMLEALSVPSSALGTAAGILIGVK